MTGPPVWKVRLPDGTERGFRSLPDVCEAVAGLEPGTPAEIWHYMDGVWWLYEQVVAAGKDER